MVMRPATVRKKLFFWCTPTPAIGECLKEFASGVGGPPCLRVWEEHRSWREGRLQPIALLVGQMTHCNAPGSSIPDDGGGEHELSDGDVEVCQSLAGSSAAAGSSSSA